MADLELQSAEISRLRRAFEVTLARHTGRDEARVRVDIEGELVPTADQAVAHGLADNVVASRKRPASERT